MKALILDEKVVDVKEQSYEVHPSMKWIDCPNNIKIGFFYDGKTFKSDEQTPEEIFEIRMIQLREIRNSLLNETDWTAISDNDLSWLAKRKWRKYRKQLRNFPIDAERQLKNNVYCKIVWPDEPSMS